MDQRKCIPVNINIWYNKPAEARKCPRSTEAVSSTAWGQPM